MVRKKTLQKISSRSTTRLRHAFHRFIKKTHWHIAKRPHHHFLRKSDLYRRWHEWQYHGHVHVSALGVYVFLVGALLVIGTSNVLAAPTTWSQTDWNNGQGDSLQDQFSSAINVDFSNSGELKLEKRFSTGSFTGDRLVTGSTNLNNQFASLIQFNMMQNYDEESFTFNPATPSQIQINDTGDYFLSLTQTVNSDASNRSVRDNIISEVRVNGSRVFYAESASSYIRNDTGHVNSSNHLGVLLQNLSPGDNIETTVRSGTNPSSNTITGVTTLYLEKVPAVEQVFSATGTLKTTGSNLNSNQAPLQWQSGRKDSAYTHNNSSSSQNITIDSPGTYFVTVNVPLYSTVQRPNIIGRVLLDGSQVNGGQFQQGYIRSFNNHGQSSMHWSGLVTTSTAGEVLSITLEDEAQAGTVTTDNSAASIYIMAAGTTGIYQAEATTNSAGSNWAPPSSARVNWATDNIIDSDIYTHSTTTNNGDVTVTAAGDYLLSFNLSSAGGGQRTNPNAEVRVNGVAVQGAESLTGYVRNAGDHDTSSNNLLVPLSLEAGDVVSVHVVNGSSVGGTMNDTTPVTMMLWKKGYQTEGVLLSNVYNAGYAVNWEAATYTTTQPDDVEIRVRSDTSLLMSGAPDFSTCDPVTSGEDISDNNCVTDGDSFVQYEVRLRAGGDTPVFSGITINYTAVDNTAPSINASDVEMFKTLGGESVTTGEWTNAATPYFNWIAGEDEDGGSGLGGYCLYLGQDSTANPVTTKGFLGESPVDPYGDCQFKVASPELDLSLEGLIGSALETSTDPYYLNVRAIDLAGNIHAESAQFEFRLDVTQPQNPLFISAPSQFVSDKDVELTWDTQGSSAATDDDSGIAGLQYRIGNAGTWYGDQHTGTEDQTDLLANDGTYTMQDPVDFDVLSEGNNVVSFRTLDNAGNISEARVTAVIKLNTVSPSPVLNVGATPEVNTENNFAFSWLPPASFTGNKNQLTYCYVFNSLPNQSNCNFTAANTTSLAEAAYATQPGENTIYVVAKDEAGNINYAAYGFTSFTANTPAPGIASNIEIADISVKQTGNWRTAMSWEPPSDIGAGVSNYLITRSTDGEQFTQIASTSATSYVDQGLSQETYYYRITACDSANNCGAQTEPVEMLPTGRYTEAPGIITQPSTGEISTRKTIIEWITDRVSDSKIALGTEPGVYGAEEISNSDQVTLHTIELSNLDPGTTYYYVARWTDGDGNTGTSTEKSFTTLPPPSVKDVSTSRVGLTSASFEFTSTNATEVKMYFGKSEGFGGLRTINTSVAESTYTIELTGLDDGSEYFYKMNPLDGDGNEYEGTILSFSTPPSPRISSFTFEPLEGEPTSTQQITWATNVDTSTAVRYGKVGTSGTLVTNPGFTTQHEINIKNLEDDSDYFIVAESRDRNGNLVVSDQQVFKTALDTRPPQVFDVTFESSIRGIGADARGQVIVSWRTDEPATSQVAYAEGSSAEVFNNRTAEEAQLSTEHIVVVSDLPSSRVYSLQPVSRDKGDNIGVGAPDTVIIGRATDGILTTIFNTLQRLFGI